MKLSKECEIFSYAGIYCHHDGYPSGVGATLLEHYNDRERAAELVNLGDISVLGERLSPNDGEEHSFERPAKGVTLAYHRDRGDGGQPDVEFSRSVESCAAAYAGIEYIYVYDNGWHVGKWSEEAAKKGWRFQSVPLSSALGVKNKEKAQG